MSQRDWKEVEDRKEDQISDREATIWSSQVVEHDVGGDLIYVDDLPDQTDEEVLQTWEQVQEAMESGLIRGVPVKVWVRNRAGRPITVHSDYDSQTQRLQMELLQTEDPRLSAPEAVMSWVRHLRGLINSPERSTRIRGYIQVLTVLILTALLAFTLGLIP